MTPSSRHEGLTRIQNDRSPIGETGNRLSATLYDPSCQFRNGFSHRRGHLVASSGIVGNSREDLDGGSGQTVMNRREAECYQREQDEVESNLFCRGHDV